ncbi:MAG: FG-GAP repeat domain-containing protein [Candidatus Asgardarchaeia archaeon]
MRGKTKAISIFIIGTLLFATTIILLNGSYIWASLNLQVELSGSKKFPVNSRVLFINDINGDGNQEIAILNNRRIIEIYTISSLDQPILTYNLSRYVTMLFDIKAKVIKIQDQNILTVVGAIPINESHETLKILCFSTQSSDYLLWYFEKDIPYPASYIFADINNDTTDDLIVSTPFSVFTVDLKTKQLLWERNIEFDYIFSTILVGDVNGDKETEIVRCSEDIIYVFFGANGTILAKLRFGTLDEKYDYFSATIYDINNDGAEDVICAREGIGVYAISFSKNNTDTPWKWLWYSSLSFAPEKVSVYKYYVDTYVYVKGSGEISVFNALTGELMWRKKILIPFETVDDINNDNLLELVGGYNGTFYFMRLFDGKILYNFTVDLNDFLNLTSQDESGTDDFHNLRETIHTYVAWTKPIVIDLNNDLKKEIIVGANMFSNDKQGTFLLVLGSNGALILKKIITTNPVKLMDVYYYFNTLNEKSWVIVSLELSDALLNEYSDLRIYILISKRSPLSQFFLAL